MSGKGLKSRFSSLGGHGLVSVVLLLLLGVAFVHLLLYPPRQLVVAVVLVGAYILTFFWYQANKGYDPVVLCLTLLAALLAA